MSDDKKKEPSSFSRVARLSGIGMQIAGTIFIFAMIGKWLDGKYPSEKNWWTIGLVLFATIMSIYSVLRQVNKMNDQEDELKNK